MKKAVLIIAILGLGYYTWKSDTFQKSFFPREYWQKQVKALEMVVQHSLLSLQNARVDLERKNSNTRLDFQEYVNEYVMGGMAHDKAVELAHKDIEADLKNAQQILTLSYEYFNRCQMHLDKAREELRKSK